MTENQIATARSPIYLTREQARAVDEIAIHRYGMLGLVLMENAGRNCAEFILQWLAEDATRGRARPVLICCGKGNNGGDGLVIARHLQIAGAAATVLLWAKPEELPGDAAANFAILQKSGTPVVLMEHAGVAKQFEASEFSDALIVDALLGTGATGEPRAPYDAAISWINARRANVIAIDLPSGLDADRGAPSATTIRAAHTLSFVGLKVGFQNPTATAFVGKVHVMGIGVPAAVIEEARWRS